MHTDKTLFAQLMDFLPWKTFHRIVDRHDGNDRVRSLSCAEQFRAMAFAQLTYRESLRDIEVCLDAQASKLYHMGFRGPVRRSTLADANEQRDWRIYATFFPDQLGVAPRRLAVQPGPRHFLTAPLHLRGVNAHMLGRLDLQPALHMRAMIDLNFQPGARQMLIGGLLPRLADFNELNLRQRQIIRRQPFVLPLDRRLVAKPFGIHRPRRHHQMRVKIPTVSLAMRGMDGEIDRRPVPIRQTLCKLSC